METKLMLDQKEPQKPSKNNQSNPQPLLLEPNSHLDRNTNLLMWICPPSFQLTTNLFWEDLELIYAPNLIPSITRSYTNIGPLIAISKKSSFSWQRICNCLMPLQTTIALQRCFYFSSLARLKESSHLLHFRWVIIRELSLWKSSKKTMFFYATSFFRIPLSSISGHKFSSKKPQRH